MRVVFFGSPDYALPMLRGLLDAPEIEVVLVVTQPARPRGRSGTPEPTPVGAMAAEAGVSVLTPERVRRDTSEAIAALAPDVGVLAASGHLLPQHLLDVFPHGVLNVHASLLPRHRGASPVAAAILAGDAEAGASIMLVVRALDAGPVVATARTAIEPLDTAGTLTDRIARIGAEAMLEVLPRWVRGVDGGVQAAPQDESLVTYAPRLAKEDGALDWSRPAEALARHVRAFHPWPLATTTYLSQQLTVHEVWPLPGLDTHAPPGTVVRGDNTDLPPLLPGRHALALVACGGEGGALALLRVQRPGKRALDIEEYLRGDQKFIGARLGTEASTTG